MADAGATPPKNTLKGYLEEEANPGEITVDRLSAFINRFSNLSDEQKEFLNKQIKKYSNPKKSSSIGVVLNWGAPSHAGIVTGLIDTATTEDSRENTTRLNTLKRAIIYILELEKEKYASTGVAIRAYKGEKSNHKYITQEFFDKHLLDRSEEKEAKSNPKKVALETLRSRRTKGIDTSTIILTQSEFIRESATRQSDYRRAYASITSSPDKPVKSIVFVTTDRHRVVTAKKKGSTDIADDPDNLFIYYSVILIEGEYWINHFEGAHSSSSIQDTDFKEEYEVFDGNVFYSIEQSISFINQQEELSETYSNQDSIYSLRNSRNSFLFPHVKSNLVTPITKKPILLNRGKVIFDKAVTVNHVTIKAKSETDLETASRFFNGDEFDQIPDINEREKPFQTSVSILNTTEAQAFALTEDQKNYALNSIHKTIEDSFKDRDIKLQRSISEAIKKDEKVAFIIEDDKLIAMINMLLGVWNRPEDHSKVHPLDAQLVNFLRSYINNNELCLYIPDIIKFSQRDLIVAYQLKGYKKYLFNNDDSVREFLKLLLAGAHFVVVHGRADVERDIPSFYLEFQQVLGMDTLLAIMHSHYTGIFLNNLGQGSIYPNLVSRSPLFVDQTPKECSIIMALLVHITSNLYDVDEDTINSITPPDYKINENHNSFFQLEGWPAPVTALYSKRHGQDYKVHTETIWNISTYGACPYSEKRGTTVFLAPNNWNPNEKLNQETIMARYGGAETPQRWLDKRLIRLPSLEK